ncbi:MAG: Mut7-C ubiquitin/RNAse domain-containing protein [Anaerolineaceae bacterium]|nr:Mut7-C ubiquitin/RNAse domain-containing protein [Anaerolineaceae bacterium]
MPIARFRFYAELNDLLSRQMRQVPSDNSFGERSSVKHIIETLGVPLTEVDLILVNGHSVDFSYLPNDGDQISVYPVFETFDISPIIRLRPQPLRETRFILDTHLGKLATYLRMLGFDSRYENSFEDDELALIASDEKRIILTRDRGLLKRKMVTHGYLVRATLPRVQIVEVIKRFDLGTSILAFRRCIRCNGLLEAVPKENIIDRIQPDTIRYFDEFQICSDCTQIYWKGSHYERMKNFIEAIFVECK